MWLPDLTDRDPVRYLAIVEALAEAITDGALRPGDRLPTHRDLAWRLGLNVSTVTQAYGEAARRQLVSGEVGRGTFVLSESREATLFGLRAQADADGRIDLSTNVPAVDPANRDLDAALAAVAAEGQLATTQGYPMAALVARARLAGSRWLAARGLEVRPADIIPTAGAQQALLAVLLALCAPGEPVLVEELTFPGIKAAARQLRLSLHGVAMDAEGVLPEALDRAARATGARVAVLVPALQNPTGATMGPARRQDVAEVMRRRRLTLVEDDVYGSLAGPPPLAGLLADRAVLVTSLSKSVAAGLRFGMIAGNNAVVHAVADEPHLTLWPLAPLMLEIACRWLDDGTALRRAAWQREEVAARCRMAWRALGDAGARPALPCPHLWLAGAAGDADPAATCRAAGVDVVPAGTFVVAREPPAFVRASLTAAGTRAHLGRALARLAAAGIVWNTGAPRAAARTVANRSGRR